MAIELVTFAEIKAFLDLEEAAITSYPALEEIKAEMVFAFEAFLCRGLETKARTQIITVYQSNDMISLLGIPVASVSSFVDHYGNEYTEANGDFLRTAYGLRMLSTEFESNELSVTYTGGVSSAGVITDEKMNSVFKRAALRQIAYEWQARDFVGAQSVSTDGGTVSRPALSLLKIVRDMLSVYDHPLKIGY